METEMETRSRERGREGEAEREGRAEGGEGEKGGRWQLCGNSEAESIVGQNGQAA